jgi:hypothetical protein
MDINGISSSKYSSYSVNQSSTTSTHSKKREKPDANKIVSELTSKLGLNDNQVIAIKKLVQNSLSQDPMSALNTSSTDSTSAKKAMESKMNQLDSDISDLLTADQKSAYEKLVADRKANAPQGDQGGPGQGDGNPPNATQITSMLTSKLGLNDNQQIEIKSLINQSLKSQSDSSDSSSDTQKTSMDKLNESIKSLLSADQKTAFEEMLNSNN